MGVCVKRARAREMYISTCIDVHTSCLCVHLYTHTNTHTHTHTHRWEAMILQDAAALQRAADAMGVGQYAKLFPLIFTMRAIDSRVKVVRVRRGSSFFYY